MSNAEFTSKIVFRAVTELSVLRNARKTAIDPRELALESQFKRAFKGDRRAVRACLAKCIDAGQLEQWSEDDHQYCLIVPHEWDWDEWHLKYRALGPPPVPGKRDGLVPIERREKRKWLRP